MSARGTTWTAAPGATRWRPSRGWLADRRVDAVAVLTLLLVALVGVPSQLVFKPLGASGTPAQLVGMAALLWWANARLVPSLGLAVGRQPVRTASLMFGGAVLASYAAGFTRVIEGAEVRAADRGLLSLAAWTGACLLAADGIERRDRLDVLLRRLTGAATLLASVGILQFLTGIDLASHFHIPGLAVNQPIVLIDARSSFRRVAGTATHPIEFGAVLSLVLPIALHYALGNGRRPRFWPCAQAATIAIAIPMSLSRSAMLALAVSVPLLLLTWPPSRRLGTFLVLAVGLVGMRFAVPGLLGTIKSLFVHIRSDPSFQGRTDDYAVVGRFIARSPVFGRGFGTFDPNRYVLLDNQYLGTLIETGVVGVLALFLLFSAGVACALAAARRAVDPDGRDLAHALTASIVATVASFATYDALAFPMATMVTFLILGCSGALWRLSGGRE